MNIFNITGNLNLDLFILQSDKNYQNVYNHYLDFDNLSECLENLGYEKSNFTNSDWMRLESLFED